MSFDIDRMKADGVSSHLINLAKLSERNDTAVFEKIAMGIENTEIFRQFISMESNAPVWDYMYAAGLCTRGEADWFKSEENPYVVDTVTVTFVTPLESEWSADSPSSYEIRQMETANPMTVEKGTTITLPNAGDGSAGSWFENSNTGTQYEGGTEFTVNANVVFGAEPGE